MPKKFIRRDSIRYSKLGKNRKKLQKWRRPKGRDNKMRERHAGYPKRPSVGYKNEKKESGKIDGKNVVVIYNISDLEKSGKDKSIILGKVGAKKKMEIIKKSNELKLKIINLGVKENAIR